MGIVEVVTLFVLVLNSIVQQWEFFVERTKPPRLSCPTRENLCPTTTSLLRVSMKPLIVLVAAQQKTFAAQWF